MVNGKYAKEKGKVALGFFISGEYQYDKDRFPSYLGAWKVKDESFNKLRENPYTFSADKSSIISTQELLRTSDFERISAHQNTSGEQFRLNGKLDWKLNEKKGINLFMLDTKLIMDEISSIKNDINNLNNKYNNIWRSAHMVQ
jgi:hypothetical protein